VLVRADHVRVRDPVQAEWPEHVLCDERAAALGERPAVVGFVAPDEVDPDVGLPDAIEVRGDPVDPDPAARPRPGPGELAGRGGRDRPAARPAGRVRVAGRRANTVTSPQPAAATSPRRPRIAVDLARVTSTAKITTRPTVARPAMPLASDPAGTSASIVRPARCWARSTRPNAITRIRNGLPI